MNETKLLSELKTAPAVFAIGNEYQIMVPVRSDLLFWVTVGGRDYYDHSNGIIRSATRMHRVTVPMTELDRAGEYTVNYRKIIERKPYFPTTEESVSAAYCFQPVRAEGKIRVYHLSDTHGNFEYTAAAGSYFGEEIDLLILNGDVPDHSGSIENFDLIYQLCGSITGGTRPCVFSRGNHDTRGFYAERIAEYTPTRNGVSYFSFRLGCIWGIVMDCGEDKPDSHDAYGHTICCHAFREEETEYLRKVIDNAEREYLAEGVKYRLVIVHNPFSHTLQSPFDIEQPLYKEWLDLLGKYVKPQAMISGHLHTTEVSHIGGQLDSLGQICPVVVGSRPVHGESKDMQDFVGCALTLDENSMQVEFTNSSHEVLDEETLSLIP